MSYQAVFDNGSATQVGTNQGWRDVCKWMRGLDSYYDRLIHLADYGWTDQLETFSRQLQRALRDHPPKDPETTHTVTGLIAFLGRAGDSGVLVVTDGASASPTKK